MKVIIPARTLTELNPALGRPGGACGDNDDPGQGPNHVPDQEQRYGGDGIAVAAGFLSNYEQLIPQNYTTRAILDLPAMLRATRTAAIFARDGSNIIRMHVIPANGEAGQAKSGFRPVGRSGRQPGRGGRRGDRGRRKGKLPSTAATFWTYCRCWSGGRWRWKQPLPPAPEYSNPPTPTNTCMWSCQCSSSGE